jgi:hypothetical protein
MHCFHFFGVGLAVDGQKCLCLVVLLIIMFIEQIQSFETVTDIHAEQLGRGVNISFK